MKQLTYAAVVFLILSSIEPGPVKEITLPQVIFDSIHQLFEVYGYKLKGNDVFQDDEFCVDCFIKPFVIPTEETKAIAS